MTHQSQIRLCIALIHNQDPKRYKYIQPRLNQLKRALALNFRVSIIEISSQPQNLNYKTYLTLFRKCFYWQINREWKNYKEVGARNIFFDIVILIRRLIMILISSKSENRRSAIEMYITDKHIKAWNSFLEMKGDFLICFEDDAVFNKESISNTIKCLEGLKKYKEKLVYIDFAGGNSLKTIEVEKLVSKINKNAIHFRKPVTNTACCYLLSSPTAKIFIQNLLFFPWLRFLCIDWLMNKMFIITEGKYKYFCYHANPQIFDHGSLTGSYIPSSV